MLWTVLLGISLFSYEGSVARVRAVEGEAMVLPYGAEDWEYLVRNDIISEGDVVKSLYDSRIVFEFGRGNVVSMGESSRIEVIRLDDDFIFRVQKGRVRVMTREASGRVILMNTDINVNEYSTVRVQRDGAFAKVSVIRGEVEIEDEIIRAGEMARIYPDGRIVIRREFHHDDFDSWAAEYERRYIVIHEVHYVPDDIYIGVYDLDSYGHWRYISGYGWVWVPDVGPDWRPYYYGHWVFRVRIGWVWVSYEEWGWVPYHYGRWAWVPDFGWVWVPGSRWRGAWVVWYEGPGWVSWAPVDPYGRPIYYITYRGKRRWVAPVVDKRSFKKPVYRYKPPKGGVYKKPVYKTVKVNLNDKILKKYEKPVLPDAPVHIKPVFREKWHKKAIQMEKNPGLVTHPVFKEKGKIKKDIDVRAREKFDRNVEQRRERKIHRKITDESKKRKIDFKLPERSKGKGRLRLNVNNEEEEREVNIEKKKNKKPHRVWRKKKDRKEKDKHKHTIKVDSMRRKVNNKLPIGR